MVVTLEDPCNQDLILLVRCLLDSGLKKTYHTKRKHSSQPEYNSISPTNVERWCDRHLRLLAQLLVK
jgi:hypothetical protein